MILTLELTPAHRTELQEASDMIARVLGEREQQLQNLEELTGQFDNWRTMAAAENAKAENGDARASAEYSAARDQSERTSKKIIAAQAIRAEHLEECARAANAGREAIRLVMAALADANLEELANLLTPYCMHRVEAIDHAVNTIAIQQLLFFKGRVNSYFVFEDNEERALAALASHTAAIALLLKGKPIVTANPKGGGIEFPAYITG